MIKYLLSSILFLAIIACQPRPMTRALNQTPVDSALFFEQRFVTDDFLAKTEGSEDRQITLKVDRYPPPIPEPLPLRFKEAEGFRVQTFAGLDSLNISQTALLLHDLVQTDSIYVFRERGLFKIQIGDYLYRPQADAMRTRLQQNGYTGAWVIKRPILIPIASDSTAGRYKIQIGATSTEDSAQRIIEKAQPFTSSELFFEQSGKYYKVFIGYFNNEAEARDALAKIRQAGFTDAWLVY